MLVTVNVSNGVTWSMYVTQSTGTVNGFFGNGH